jgi:glycine cleavage system H lipoate-binding protein/ABC-type phosphate transport system substrate-binding protein
MKKTITLLISLLLLNFCMILSSKELISEKALSQSDSINVLTTTDLYNITAKWASEYNKLYPEEKIKIILVPDNKITDRLLEDGKIAIVSNENYSGYNSQTLWKAVVARDVIVPIINSKNPFFDEILKKGVSPEAFSQFVKNSKSTSWGSLLNNNEKKGANYYWINEESLKRSLAGFLKTDQMVVKGTEVKNGEEMISAIQKDPYGFGYCKMINILDSKGQGIVENIKLLPIDRNGNGIIDYGEKIYDDINVFTRGVWIGKYPKALISNVFSVSSKQPQNGSEIAFLNWILTDGQQFLLSDGYSDLLISKRQSTVEKLNRSKVDTTTIPIDNSVPKIALIILASIIVLGFAIDASIRFVRRRKEVAKNGVTGSHSALNEKSILIPKGLYFDKSHTWAFMDQDGIVKIGVDDFLQHVTGPITRIRMKSVGNEVKKGEHIMSIVQNGKQLNLYAAISGTITEQNKLLDTNPSMINISPYNEGWIYKIEPDNWNRESQLLFMAEKQKEHIKEEFSRLRDFLARVMNPDKVLYAMAILQDGGELSDEVLSNFGPEIWEDFQTNFIDPSRQIWFYEIF